MLRLGRLFSGIACLAALSGCGVGEVAPRTDVGAVPESPGRFSSKVRDDRVAILHGLLDAEIAGASAGSAKRLKFYKSIAPAAIETMLEIESERAAVYAYRTATAKGAKPNADLADEIEVLSRRYASEDPDELLRRIDAIPLDLLFTQAAIESASGTSPVARDCMNLFGVHAASKAQQCAGHPILAAYPSFTGSIERYVLLLNSGSAYKTLRKNRAASRAAVGDAGALDTAKILPGLLPYSERGQKYLDDVSAGMRADHLDRLYRDFVTKIAD